MTDPAYAATIKAARYQKRFEDTGEEYSALDACIAFCVPRGFSLGLQQGGLPLAVMLGDMVIGKWSSLDAQDREDLNGIIFPTTGDFRRGAVVLCLNSRASEKVIAAFLAEPSDALAQKHVEGAPA